MWGLDLGFRASGLGFRISGFTVWGLGLRDFRFRVWGLGFRDFRAPDSKPEKVGCTWQGAPRQFSRLSCAVVIEDYERATYWLSFLYELDHAIGAPMILVAAAVAVKRELGSPNPECKPSVILLFLRQSPHLELESANLKPRPLLAL